MSEPRPGPGFAAALAGIAFCLGMVTIQAFKVPVLRYHPVERSWDLSAQGSSLPMLLYGQLLWAGLAAAAVFAATRWLLRRPAGPVAWRYALGWLLLSSAVALSYYAHANWP